MNPNEPRHPWPRLVAAARQVPDQRDEAAPYGFSTRVAALAFARLPSSSNVLERLALRAVAVACLLAIASVVINYPLVSNTAPAKHRPSQTEEEVQFTPVEDPVTTLLDA